MEVLKQMVRRHRIAGSSREVHVVDGDANTEGRGGGVVGELYEASTRPAGPQPCTARGAPRSSCNDNDDEIPTSGAESERLRELSAGATQLVDLSIDDVRLLSMNYTTCPRLALLYYHCCSNDPRAHVFNDERLLGEGARETVERLRSALDPPVGLSHVQTAKDLAEDRIGLAKDIHACASCCEILHDHETGIEKKPLSELVRGFRLTEEEVCSLAGIPETIRRSHVQVLEFGGEYYHLNPDLVPDVDQVVLCRECCRDPRSVRFSIASGHDYGRPGSLPVLNDVAGNCIAPVRRFGMELLLSGKHTSGHSICFPSDGPVQCAKVLPWTDVEVLPRVTFVGATGLWQSKKAAYRRLYELPCDDIYSWLRVLQCMHGAFREHGVVVADIEKARQELGELEQFIDSGVICSDSEHFNAVDEVTRSERYGDDAKTDGDDGELLVTRGAVLKNVAPASGTEGSSLAVELLLGMIDKKSESSVPPVVSINRGEDPVVEWSGNGNTIASVFPRLFMRGGASLPDGSWGKPLIQHLMRYYDGRFEQDTRFVAMLFNQMQRHAAVRRAAKLGSSHTRVLERFGALVNSGDFRDRLVIAKENPERAESRRLNASLLRVLSLVGGCVPFSPFERAAARPKIAALRYRYGVPQHWVTIAPPEHDNVVLHRIAMIRERREWNLKGSTYASGKCTHGDLPEHLRSSARARLVVANRYPALAVQVFERCVRAVFDDIVMSPSSVDTRRSRSFVERGFGAYGKIAAHCAVVEAQVDGRLHVHSLLYGSAYTPELLTRVACCPDLCQEAASWIESVCTTKLRAATHLWRSSPRAEGERLPRAYEIELSASTEQTFFSAAEKRASTTNFHSHSHTCYKGARGKYMCRLARPAGVFPGPTQPLLVTRIADGDPSKGTRPQLIGQPLDAAACASLDAGYDINQRELFGAPLAGPVLWEMERPEEDAMFVETNLVLASLTASHTNSSMINGEDSGDMVEQYQQAYMTKDEPGLRNAIPVLITAVDHTIAYPSRADDAATDIRKGKYLAARTVNAFTGAHEWSHTTMVYALCGHRSFVSSDTFWYLFPHQLVKAARSLRGDDSTVTVGSDVDSPSKDVDVELETLVAMANNDSHATTTDSSGDTGAGARSFRVGDRVVFVTQAESYQHGGEHFECYSALEFECVVDVVIISAGEDEPPPLRGRPRRKRFPFASTHPLSGQYDGCIRAKMHTPILGGHSPPSWISGGDDKAGKSRNATAEYVMALFTPWTTTGPAYPPDEEGLLRLCRDWDHSKAPFLNRQRIRSVRNLLKRGHRSWNNEQLITEWRNRNVDLWGTLQKRSGRDARCNDQDRERDEEMLGVLPTTVDMYQWTRAVAARQTKAPSQLRRVQGMVASIMDDGGETTRVHDGSSGTSLYFPRPGSEPLKRLAARLQSLTKLPWLLVRPSVWGWASTTPLPALLAAASTWWVYRQNRLVLSPVSWMESCAENRR